MIEQTPYERFEKLLKQIVRVPKSEIDKARKDHKKKQKK